MNAFTGKLVTLHREMKSQGVLIYFSGPFSQTVIEGLGSSLRRKISDQENMSKATRAFSIFIELSQNILNYSSEEPKGQDNRLAIGVIVVGQQDDKYYIQCGNKIDNQKSSRIEAKLNSIAGMDKDALKKAYKEARKAGPDEESLGGGLGFLEMARRATEPLEYSIEEWDKDHSFFTITAVI